MSKPQLKIVPDRTQARLVIAKHRAAQNGQRRLTDEEIARVDGLTIYEQLHGEILIDHHSGFQSWLTWRFIFDCKVPLNLFGVAVKAKESGYRFFAYASRVYFVGYRSGIEETGLDVSDIKESL